MEEGRGKEGGGKKGQKVRRGKVERKRRRRLDGRKQAKDVCGCKDRKEEARTGIG